MDKRTEFQERCLRFGATSVQLARRVTEQTGPSPLSRQLEKCATSIGANVAEAKSAQSRADFLSKFEIALKEAQETDYWLRLLKETSQVDSQTVGSLLGECGQITAILVASIKTAKRNGGIVEPRLQK